MEKTQKRTIVYGGGFVMMENELSLYNILGYSENPDIRVTPMTIDIYRALKQRRMNNESHPLYGKTWISMERLAVEMAINRKTVSKHIKVLEKVGLIRSRRFYRNGKRHVEFSFPEILTEDEFITKYPHEMAKYREKLKEIQKHEGTSEIFYE